MLYIHEDDLKTLGIPWADTMQVIGESIKLIDHNDYYQPLKPYVRFKDNANRIIAMPAYVGAPFCMAGIKWIASFPKNLSLGIPRAHSITVLNDVATGKPLCIINTSLISGIRTASLSGYIIREFMKAGNKTGPLSIGIVGFGPIGQLHLEVAAAIIGDNLDKVYIYDRKAIDRSKVPSRLHSKLVVCDDWCEPYENADVFITATVSSQGYIDSAPKPGSLLLNVSLRDFKPEIMHHVGRLVVDNWEEVCRENTDIENMHKVLGLQKNDTYSLVDFISNHPFNNLAPDEVVMFNPMGMAIFDIAMGGYYYRAAMEKNIGTILKN